MSKDYNNPKFGQNIEFPDDNSINEGHREDDETPKSNVKGWEHPLFSPTATVDLINNARNLANTQEKELSGKIKAQVFKDLLDAAKMTKVPYDLLLFCADWKEDITKRSGASDMKDAGKKILNYIPELRKTLGRDPLNAEVFMAFVLESASKVKQVYDKNEKEPEKDAQALGTQKDNIIMYKMRNGKPILRTNREVYDFFYKRFITSGKVAFKEFLGKPS